MRARGIDYFENSRRATLAQRAYHVANPRGYPNYDRDEWGLTASQVPDGYRARGAPPAQNDDGTLAPTAPGGSIVFTPDESIAALRTMRSRRPGVWGKYGFRDAYNVSQLWYSNEFLGIDQGPILLMIENHLTGRIWERFMQNEHVQRGLELAGFRDTDTGFGEQEPDGDQLELAAPYPNPFDQTVHLEFVLPTDGPARVSVFDVLGRRVAIIADRWLAEGSHGVSWTPRGAPSGVYYVKLDVDGRTVTRAVVLTRQ
jgi:hypothetical protein